MKKNILYLIVIIPNIVFCQFINIENGIFKKNGEPFYPKIINYSVSIKTNNNNYYLSPNDCYCKDGWWDAEEEIWYWDCCKNDPQICMKKIEDDIQNIHDWGFDAIRLSGFSVKEKEEGLVFEYSVLPINELINQHFEKLEIFLDIVKKYDLKIIIVTGGCDSLFNEYSIYLKQLAERFREDSTIMAYDLYNEPEYSDNGFYYTKFETCEMVSDWYNSIREVNQNHLVTIGLGSSLSTLNWDPYFMTVDFLSFHPYPRFSTELNFNQVLAELKWYSSVINKPWMIGETGLAGNNDIYDTTCYIDTHVPSEEDQRNYAEISINQCFDCGGIAYSWWQYQDVFWGREDTCFDNTIGLKYRDENALNQSGKEKLIVTDNIFKNYMYNFNPNNCEIDQEVYFNPNGYNGYHVKGYVLDEYSNPIKDAVILAQSGFTGEFSVSHSDENGYFDIYSQHKDAIIYKIRISYPGYSVYQTEGYSSVDTSEIIEAKLINYRYNDYEEYSESIIQNGQSKIVFADNSITTHNVKVNNGGKLSLYADEKININQNFTVDSGAYFTAKVGTFQKCNTFANNEKNILSEYKIQKQIVKLSEIGQKKLQDIGANFEVYPNPTSRFLYFKPYNIVKKIYIIDIEGRTLFELNLLHKKNCYTLDFQDYKKGMYIVTFITENGTYRKKIILK